MLYAEGGRGLGAERTYDNSSDEEWQQRQKPSLNIGSSIIHDPRLKVQPLSSSTCDPLIHRHVI